MLLILLFVGTIKSKQSLIGLWLVAHAILIFSEFIIQYTIRFGKNSNEYDEETRILKSIELSSDLISFYFICRLNNVLIDEKYLQHHSLNINELKKELDSLKL
ncbi:hypothetical protein PVAND_010373 [Polypedilum vanderplanki]|uniref:Uncharacterized protein n=1 Tax=Polypedilum vanderplanki TaxID=319348 RepID=A0A9J6CH25_POLVA|nr:hypothetical protein PVAND_010373 [Polypedilum vanderplanki]